MTRTLPRISHRLRIVLLLAPLLLAACGKPAEPAAPAAAAPTAQPAQPTKIKVGVLKMAALTNAYVAQQEGMFRKNGLDAELVEFKTGGDAINAQQSGSVDIILTIPGNGFTAIERKFDLKAIFQNESAKAAGPDSGAIIVGADATIKTVKELAGKKVAVSALHSQGTVAVQKVMKQAGVDLATVQFVEMPLPSMGDALKNKQIDAVATVDPFTTRLTSTGVGKVVSWSYVESVPQQPVGVWFAKGKYIQDNPAVIASFNSTMKESIDYMMADEPRAKTNVAAFTGLDPALVKDMPLLNWNYRVDPAKWQQVIDMMIDSGEMKGPHSASDYFDPSIQPYVVK